MIAKILVGTFIFIPLMAKASPISLEKALGDQAQQVISPVLFQGSPLVTYEPGRPEHALLVCASLGYTRLVSYGIEKKDFSEIKGTKVALVTSNGGYQEGSTVFYDLVEAKRDHGYFLKHVVCAR